LLLQRGSRILLAAALTLSGAQAEAHGFGERYELPLPLALFLSASGLVVAVSFALMALFLRPGAAQRGTWRLRLDGNAIGKFLAARGLAVGLQVAGVAIYALVVAAGLFGDQRAFKNIAPVMVWVVTWVGLAYVAALAGNLWNLVNPLSTLFRWFGGERLALARHYPSPLGQWPAVALFLAFAWLELVSPDADDPRALAIVILAYSALTWTGMLLFGCDAWLRNGELFSVVYGYLASFAPLEVRATGDRRELSLRPYAAGLLRREPLPPSAIVMVVLVLAAVSFDGFLETPAWATLVEQLGGETKLLKSLGLLAAPLLFLAAYLAACSASAHLGGAPRGSLARLAGLFVLTLVPIAIAYHIAHYLSFFLAAAQYLGPLASDPFGRGWDLFGGARQFIRPTVIDARTVWYVSVAAIVIGHVIAVMVAHRVALSEFASRRNAMRSQYPLVALMVAYTMTSLWIIAQPIVTGER